MHCNVPKQQNPAGQKMLVIECGVCRWQTVLYTWLNLNRRLNFVLCSPHTHIYCATAHMIGASRGRGLSWDTSDTAADTIDRQPCIARSQISMFWSAAFNSTKTVAATPWRSKTVRGKLQYSISGSLEIQGMVRGYSFDIRFTLSRNIQSGYSEDIPSMVFLPRRTCPFGA